jgi:hypothetical protein
MTPEEQAAAIKMRQASCKFHVSGSFIGGPHVQLNPHPICPHCGILKRDYDEATAQAGAILNIPSQGSWGNHP